MSTYTITISAHHAVKILSVHYPENSYDQLVEEQEYYIRTMWNERGRVVSHYTRSDKPDWNPEMPVEMYSCSSKWPKKRYLSPLAIIHKEDESPFYTNAAPPVNAWWKAEDRITDSPIGTWELVWREWRGDIIHEGWVQRVLFGTEGDFMHYLTRYPGDDFSPLPLAGKI